MQKRSGGAPGEPPSTAPWCPRRMTLAEMREDKFETGLHATDDFLPMIKTIGYQVLD